MTIQFKERELDKMTTDSGGGVGGDNIMKLGNLLVFHDHGRCRAKFLLFLNEFIFGV